MDENIVTKLILWLNKNTAYIFFLEIEEMFLAVVDSIFLTSDGDNIRVWGIATWETNVDVEVVHDLTNHLTFASNNTMVNSGVKWYLFCHHILLLVEKEDNSV